jgi:hypothetical protein
MSVSPPVIERVISCRYPSIEADRFVDAHKRWQDEIGKHGFEQKLVKHWDVNIPEDPQTHGPDLSNASMTLNEGYHYQKDGNVILRPCRDLFSVNLLGVENTSFEKAKQLAGQFIPMWMGMAEIERPSAVQVVYVDQFTNAHFAPFIDSDGILKLDEIFQLPVFCPVGGGAFIPPLHQEFTWTLKENSRALLSVQLDILPCPNVDHWLARLMTTTTLLAREQDEFSNETFHKTLMGLHKIHIGAFRKMLTPEMLKHCGIESLSAERETV